MAEPEILEAIFQNAAEMTAGHLKLELAHRHMLALADTYEGWAQDPRMPPERSAQLLGWAERMRRLAREVGPTWDPPAPPTVTIIGFLGRSVLGEPSPPPTPQLRRLDIGLRADSVLASPLALFSGLDFLATCAACDDTRAVPVNSLLANANRGESVASVVGRLRCRTCRAEPVSVFISESPPPGRGRQVKLV